LIKKIDDAVDDILYSMNSPTNAPKNYQAENADRSKRIYIFKTNNRKRKGQLKKFCNQYLDESWGIQFDTVALRLDEIDNLVNQIKNKKDLNFVNNHTQVSDGRDIQIFKDSNNWYPWQKQIFNKLFEKENNFKRIKFPDHRKIITLIDFKGNSGKSSFWKYLYANNKQDIGRLTYGGY